MRKLATVLSLLVLCCASASAQSWNLAHDPAASLTGQVTVTYNVPNGLVPELTKAGNTIDEVILWRTGDGALSRTLTDVDSPSIQGQAAVMNDLATGRIQRPASSVTRTKVWYSDLTGTHVMNFEVRWGATGTTMITRLPDDAFIGAVN